MNRIWIGTAIAIALPAFATTPPLAASFEKKVCMADSIAVGQASKFKIVRLPECKYRGDRKHLGICDEVQVQVAVQEVLRPGSLGQAKTFTFRFGGGLFSVDDLRADLLQGPRYFFLLPAPGDKLPVFRTSYPWFLGVSATPENALEVRKALDTCPAPDNSFKPAPLRGSA